MVCQLGYEELSTEADPDRAYRPFTDAACGFVPAEGGAMLVVEDERTARERGARVRALIAGHAATFTGASRWAETRQGLAQAIAGALQEAGCAPGEVDAVFADALGVPEADRAEALAIADALGAHGARIPRHRAEDGHRARFLRGVRAGHGRGGARDGARPDPAHPERLRRQPRSRPRDRPRPARRAAHGARPQPGAHGVELGARAAARDRRGRVNPNATQGATPDE
ncbi:hypothetical protein GCM10020256_35780 [Streptomyces thermocoprophilus]